jgi:large subunit ribosomal protein L4
MLEVPLYNHVGEKSGTIALNPAVWGLAVNPPLLHQVVSVELANRHQGTASVLSRGEVNRGGGKIYRQKGTGRARHGSRRVPLWKGGGVAFGPQPGKVEKKVPRKMRGQAMSQALSAKVADQTLYVVESLDISEAKTRAMVSVLRNMGLAGRKVLIVLDAPNPVAQQAGANIAGTRLQRLHQTSVVDLLTHDCVVLTQAAVNEIERRASA